MAGNGTFIITLRLNDFESLVASYRNKEITHIVLNRLRHRPFKNDNNPLNKTKKHDKHVRTGLDYVLVSKSIVSIEYKMWDI